MSLSVSILAALLILASCQQSLTPEPEPAPEGELITNPGRIHNEMLSYYYKNRRLSRASTEEKIGELLDLSCEYLQEQGYDPRKTESVRQQVEDRFRLSPMKSAPAEGFFIREDEFMNQLSEMGTCSPFFLQEIGKVLELGHRDESRQAIREYVNSTFMGIHFDDPEDRAAQQLFGDIFNSSYTFWESYSSAGLKGAQLKKSTYVIINDGIGGVLGSVFGPIGSIVTATAFSAATNEEIR